MHCAARLLVVGDGCRLSASITMPSKQQTCGRMRMHRRDQKYNLHVYRGGKELHSEEAHACAIRALAWSPDGSLLMTGADDKNLRVLETSGWTCVASR